MSKTEISDTADVGGSAQERNRQTWLWPVVLITIGVAAVAAFLLTREGADSDPLATVEEYFNAFNSGEVDATLAFLVDEGGEFNVTSEPDSPFAQSDYDGTVRLMAWSVAGGTAWDNRTCSVVEGSESPVLVECEFQIADALRSTMGLPDLPASLTVAVDDGQLVAFEETFALLPGEGASATYLDWLSGTYPDEVGLAADVEWASIDEAVAAGEARVRHIEEWAESLAG